MKKKHSKKKTKSVVYIIRKYVLASSATDAIKKEKNQPVHDVWLDEKPNLQLSSAIGFIPDDNDI
jgi:hypothetical protein